MTRGEAVAHEQDTGPYEPFEPEYMRELVGEVFRPVLEHYFRPRLLGAEKLPESGPALLIANHSGSAFPWDAMVLDALLWQRDRCRTEAKFRSVYERELAINWWMRPFGIDNFWRRGGAVDLTFDNFGRLLERGERVVYYPEGVPGIGKGFGRRYRLQRFSTSFVIHAARHDVPVYPVSIVNAEWVMPFNYTFPPLDRLVDRLFRVPFLPLPGALFALTFPWAWFMALPARMVFVVGDPIDVAGRVRDGGLTRLDRSERPQLQEIAGGIRDEMQRELDGHVRSHGRRPYAFRSLLREWWNAGRLLPRVLPLGWPVRFVCHERNRRRPPARNRLHALLRDWDLIGYYLPFGWWVLSFAHSVRRPPHGYRGLTREERRRQEGSFLWNLGERPLPPK